MTNGYVAARLICDAINGKEPAPWATTFDSTRIRSTINAGPRDGRVDRDAPPHR